MAGLYLGRDGRQSGVCSAFHRPSRRAETDALRRKKRVSVDGGNQPRWRSDGKELFYMSLDRKIVSVSIKTGPPFEAGGPRHSSTHRVSEALPVTTSHQTADDFS